MHASVFTQRSVRGKNKINDVKKHEGTNVVVAKHNFAAASNLTGNVRAGRVLSSLDSSHCRGSRDVAERTRSFAKGKRGA